MINKKTLILFIFSSTVSSLFLSCFNPFSPKVDNSLGNENILSDQKTVEGLFQNFKYAYTFRDSTIYGQLLASEFVFTYFDYDLGVDISWDRQTDMKTTEGLFSNTQSLNLIWNNIVFQKGDSLNIDVKRSFNLNITFNPSDITNFNGFVDMTLSRPTANDKWKIIRWRDLTNP